MLTEAESNPSDILSDAVPVEVSLAGLPTTLIVSGLVDQLSKASKGYTDTDYLTPILDAAALLRQRFADSPDERSQIDTAFARITGSVTDAIASDWGVDLEQLGLDGESASFQSDVRELYSFFVTSRVANAEAILRSAIVLDRRRVAERYRKSVEKRNQSVSETRRELASFEDVVIFVSMRQIVDDFLTSPNVVGTLADALRLLGAEGTVFLNSVAWKAPDDGFILRYLQPVLSSQRHRVTLALSLADWWKSTAPKKDPALQGADE